MAGKKGVPKSREWKNKVSQSLKGRSKSEETRKRMSDAQKGHVPTRGMTGKYHSKESKQVMSKSHLGEKSYNWKGGLCGYYHSKAKELFGRPDCQDCGITLEQYKQIQKQKQFDMHCISKDYNILEQWNWQCLCRKCHWKTFER